VGNACDLNTDTDIDGIPNPLDNCPEVPNVGQSDTDEDGVGDACDSDDDDDGILDSRDNCHFIFNPDQENNDHDLRGDLCDQDDDNDTIPDSIDLCSFLSNFLQLDSDRDGIGDPCDDDVDGDEIRNEQDNCPQIANSFQEDFDEDGIGDLCDIEREFVRGDSTRDGKVDIADPIRLLNFLFLNGTLLCLVAADASQVPIQRLCPEARCPGDRCNLQLPGYVANKLPHNRRSLKSRPPVRIFSWTFMSKKIRFMIWVLLAIVTPS